MHICKPDNFMYLNDKYVIYPHVANIVLKYLEEKEGNFDTLKKSSSKTKEYFSSSILVPIPKSAVLSKNKV